MKRQVSKLLFIFFSTLIFYFQPFCVIAAEDPANPGGSSGVDIGYWFSISEGSVVKSIKNTTHLNSIGGLISTILPNVFVVAGLIIFFFIVLGGFTMITNAGNPDKQKEGSQMLTGALIGFAIIFGAYWLVQLIGLILMGDANAILTPKVTSP